MTKGEFKEQFLKLTKQEKDNLTIGWLVDLVKNNIITIRDIVDVVSSCYDGLSDIDKFNKLADSDYISASAISRVFGYGYSKSISVIKLLIEHKAIERTQTGYKIISLANFRKVGKILFEL